MSGSKHGGLRPAAATARCIVATIAIAAWSLAAAQVIFTEYVEGTGHNKALEITNVGDAPVDLSACRVAMYFNGSNERGQDFTLEAILAPGQSHVFYHYDTNGNYTGAFLDAVESAPSAQSAGFGWFNGDDAIVLECAGDVADSLGQLGVQQRWGVDLTLRRSGGPARTDPREPWDAEAYGWTRHPKDTFDGLGQP